jgi:NTP pyrophosphatase (non-canonical NTP hydrolase)
MNRAEALARLSGARELADIKWGRGTGSNIFEDDRNLAVTVLTEEVGEIARAVLEHDKENLQAELLDVMQVCCAWLEAME